MKIFRNPESIHTPLGKYHHQVEILGNERLIVLAGQIGMNKDGTMPPDQMEQISIALDNVVHNLEAALMKIEDLVKLNFFLVEKVDLVKFRDLLAEKLNGHQPCMTGVYVAALLTPEIKVEIEAIASAGVEQKII